MQQHFNLPSVLLVEDSTDDYEATIRSFKKAQFNNPIQWCKSGKDALDFLKHQGKYASTEPVEKPALVLMDLNMPGIDGRKALAMIKADQELKQIPVVILTTSNAEKDIDQCYQLGANTYIQKPVTFEHLIEAMRCINEYWFGIALLPKDTTSN